MASREYPTGPDGSGYSGRVMDGSPYFGWHKYFDDRRGRRAGGAYDEPFEDRPGREASLARWRASSSASRATARTSSAWPRSRRPHLRPHDRDVRRRGGPARALARDPARALRRHEARRRTGPTPRSSLLRHIGGLRREICVLLTAEVVALSYYRVLAARLRRPGAARGLRAHPARRARPRRLPPRDARQRVLHHARARPHGLRAHLARVRRRPPRRSWHGTTARCSSWPA